MRIKTFLFTFSIFINLCFLLLFIIASLQPKRSNVSFADIEGFTAAAVVSVPESGGVVFDLIEITLNKGEKAFLQFALLKDGKQGNMLVTPLFDPEFISVSQTALGLEITALTSGSTLVQTLTQDGIKDLSRIIINE